MRNIVVVDARLRWLRGTLRYARNRGGSGRPLRLTMAIRAPAARSWCTLALGGRRLLRRLCLFRRRRDGSIAHIGDRLADQLLDRRDRLGVVRSRDDGDRHAGAAGAAGAADPVHVVIGVDRDVEIVDVAHLWNVESARGNIRSDQQRDLILAELFERGRKLVRG